jgi:hypothetical protein
MRYAALAALAMLSACMGGDSAMVLSDPPDLNPGGGQGGAIDQPDGPLGHAGFAILLNDERAAGGVAVVREHPLLNQAAQLHAEDMVAHDYLSHTDRDGGRARDRVAAVGYDWDFIAENIAQGFGSNAAVMEAWMASPGHAENIMDPRAEDFGLGLEGETWVLLLGSQFD